MVNRDEVFEGLCSLIIDESSNYTRSDLVREAELYCFKHLRELFYDELVAERKMLLLMKYNQATILEDI